MSEPIFEFKMKVRDYECDAQGIVNNANYQHYYEVVRHEFLEDAGLNFLDLHNEGVDLVLVSAYVQYKRPLAGNTKFTCTVDSVQKDGIRYIFNQKIVRDIDGLESSSGKFEVVSTGNGRVTSPVVLDKALGKFLIR